MEALLRKDFGWQYFLKLARYHHYEALAYRFCIDLDLLERIPGEVQRSLRDGYFLAQARFIKKEQELIELIDSLGSIGIDPIIIKGIPQANLLYADPGVRISKDIDILVHPDDIEQASRALSQLGYAIFTWPRTIEDYRDFHYHFIFTRGESMDSVVEVHWNLVHPHIKHAVDMEKIRCDAVEAKVRDREVRTLNPPQMLWYNSVHLSYNSFLELRNLVDLWRLARKLKKSEWNEVISYASGTATMREVGIALDLCGFLNGDFLQGDIKRKLRPGVWDRLLLTSVYYPRGLVWDWVPFNDTHRLAMMFTMTHGFNQKMKFFYRLIIPDRWALRNVYFNFEPKSARSYKYCCRGIYFICKILFVRAFLGMLIRARILGEDLLDPSRYKEL